ncbi:MAG TPA: hypothetical protein VEA59_00060 [Patescibacteria group bacterium]|nr:hypothetical protein [Patescibacteria group bacterium]
MTQSISQQLLSQGIGYLSDGTLLPFPLDQRPLIPSRNLGLTATQLGTIIKAWLQWQKFSKAALSHEHSRIWFRELMTRHSSALWGDYERSELQQYFKHDDYFFGPHVTRLDMVIDAQGNPRLLDPNVMPYGISPLVASSQLLGLSSHHTYLERLGSYGGTWVADRSHGNAHSLAWLCRIAGLNFQFTDEHTAQERIIRQTRLPLRGTKATVNAPGIRTFESQLWSALISLPGFAQFVGFHADRQLHKLHAVPSYLARVEDEHLFIASSFTAGQLQHVAFEEFVAMQWAAGFKKVFLKGLYTSGSHQVTHAEFKQAAILKAVRRKFLLPGDKYFLLQPALPSLHEGERVRLATYIGYDGAIFGTELTAVPAESSISHLGSHATLSYLVP